MKDRDIVAASELMGQVTARAAKLNLGSDAWRLKGALDLFLIRYSISEDEIANSQLRETSGLHGRSFDRAVKALTKNRLFARETNGLKGRAARTRWRYVSDEEAAGLSEIDAITGSPERPQERPQKRPQEWPQTLRLTEYRSPRPEGPRYADVDSDPVPPGIGTALSHEERLSLSKTKSEESGQHGLAVLNGRPTVDPFSQDPPISPNGDWKDASPSHRKLKGIRERIERERGCLEDGWYVGWDSESRIISLRDLEDLENAAAVELSELALHSR